MNLSERPVHRRHFISDLIHAALGLKIIALLKLTADHFADDHREVDLSGIVTDEQNKPLNPDAIEPGAVRPAMNGANKLFVIRDGDRFRALSRSCTHKSCTVKWDAENGWIRCPCHGSRFARTGEAIKGPAKKPLQSVGLKIENGVLVVERPQDAGVRS